MHETVEQILANLKATWRYRWYAVVCAWVIALGGWIVVYQMPERYESFARVYVDTQSVLRPLLSGIVVQPNLDQMTAMMSRTLISGPNLEKVIQMAHLDAGMMSDHDRVQLITHLSKELSVKSAGTENLYTISFVDEDPQVAKRVVQSLLTIFVEGSLSDKRRDSASALRFIDEQLEGYREKLVAAENAVTEFKRRHLGLNEGQTFFVRLAAAKDALSQAELELKEAEHSRDSIKKKLAVVPETTPVSGDKNMGEETNPELDARIHALEQKLDNLRLSYTEQYPDIVAIVPIIAQLKAQKKEEAKLRGPHPSAPQAKDPVYEQLTVSLTTAEANVAAMQARVAEYGSRYAELKASANAVPQVETEYTQLTRDYLGYKARYDDLLMRRGQAQISGDMETNDTSMGFRVIDPPFLPAVPRSPARPLKMTMVLLAALGLGFGFAFMLSQVRPTFNDERLLKEATGLPVLGTVVVTWTDAQKSRRMTGLIALLLSFLSLVSAYVGIMAMLMLTASRS